MVHTFLCFVYRQPHLSPQEFRDHVLTDWLPVLRAATEPFHPLSVVMHFPERAVNGAGTRFGFQNMFKDKVPDDTPIVALGDPTDVDMQWDAVSEWRFKDELSLMQAAGMLHQGPLAGDLAEEEAKWCQSERTKMMFLGESVELFPATCDQVPARDAL